MVFSIISLYIFFNYKNFLIGLYISLFLGYLSISFSKNLNFIRYFIWITVLYLLLLDLFNNIIFLDEKEITLDVYVKVNEVDI